MPVHVRPALPADMPTLSRLGALLVSVHHEFDPDRFTAATASTPSAYADFLAAQAARPECVVLVAEEGGTVVGYAFGGVEGTDYMALRGPAGVIYDLIVESERRRQGVGGLLLDRMIAALGDGGAPRVVLSTAARNEAAQALFAGRDFRRTMIEMTRELESGDGHVA